MTHNNVLYFNGKTSTAYNAEVFLHSETIHIKYVEGFEQKQITWNIVDIHKPEFALGNCVVLRHGKSFPYETIEIRNEALSNKILDTYGLNNIAKKYTFFANNGIKGVFLGILIFISVFMVFYVVIIPKVATYTALKLPVRYEKKIGRSIKDMLISNDSIHTEKTKALHNFYNTLNFKSDYDLNFTVIDAPIQNAFAVPGGHIVIYTGIIDHMESPEDLAALIGHELVHVNERHATQGLFKSLSSYIVLSILLNDINGVTAALIDHANTFNNLSFSRALEQEADEKAVLYMKNSNINPKGIINLLNQLHTLKSDVDVPEFLSTHPITEYRIEYVSKLIDENDSEFYTKPDWDEFWSVLKGNE